MNMLNLWSFAHAGVSFAWRFASGVFSLLLGKPWRISIYEGAQASYTDKVWAQGSETMTERERHFCQVGATMQGYPISEAEQAAKCEAVIRYLKLNEKVRRHENLSLVNVAKNLSRMLSVISAAAME